MSPVIKSILLGQTKSDEGVPLGLVNYMVLNRQGNTPTCRIGIRKGYLWFRLDILALRQTINIWSDA